MDSVFESFDHLNHKDPSKSLDVSNFFLAKLLFWVEKFIFAMYFFKIG